MAGLLLKIFRILSDSFEFRGLAPNETASLLSPNDISYDKTEDDIYTPFIRNKKIFREVMPFSLEEDGQQLGTNALSRVSPYNGP